MPPRTNNGHKCMVPKVAHRRRNRSNEGNTAFHSSSNLHVQRHSLQHGLTSTNCPSILGKNIQFVLHSEHRMPRRMPSCDVACHGITPYVGGRSPSSFHSGALSSGLPIRLPQLQKNTFVLDIIRHPSRSCTCRFCASGCTCRRVLHGLDRSLVRRERLHVRCCVAWP